MSVVSRGVGAASDQGCHGAVFDHVFDISDKVIGWFVARDDKHFSDSRNGVGFDGEFFGDRAGLGEESNIHLYFRFYVWVFASYQRVRIAAIAGRLGRGAGLCVGTMSGAVPAFLYEGQGCA